MSERLTREQIRTWRQYGYRLERLADTALSLMDENERLKLTLGSIRAGFHPNTWNCWMPESCAEAVAAGEDHGWCPACVMRAALADTEEGLT